jgi:hypothetical protein
VKQACLYFFKWRKPKVNVEKHLVPLFISVKVKMFSLFLNKKTLKRRKVFGYPVCVRAWSKVGSRAILLTGLVKG